MGERTTRASDEQRPGSPEKVLAIAFFAFLTVLFSLALLSSETREGRPKIGIAGALGLQGWVLMTAGIVISLAFIVALTVSLIRSRRKG